VNVLASRAFVTSAVADYLAIEAKGCAAQRDYFSYRLILCSDQHVCSPLKLGSNQNTLSLRIIALVYFCLCASRYGSMSTHIRCTVALSTGCMIGVPGSFSENISKVTLPQFGEIASGR
jgi:hypothetical protein